MPRSAPRPALRERTIADRLEPVRDQLDRLHYEATLTPLSHQDFDRLEEQAATIAAELRAVFRGGAR